jgi:hypothetical protein
MDHTWQFAHTTAKSCAGLGGLLRRGEQCYEDAVARDDRVREWLEFARRRADRLQHLPRMPEDLEFRPEDLTPFMGGWSPYGACRDRG